MSNDKLNETQDMLIRYMLSLGIDLKFEEEILIKECKDSDKLKKALWIATVFFEKKENVEIKNEIIDFLRKK